MIHMYNGSRNKLKTALSFFLLFMLVAGFVSVLPRRAMALASGGIGGYPAHADPGIQYSDSWFIYNLDAGESKADGILLTNTSEERQTVKLYAVDSVATSDGNFSLKAETDPKAGVGAWIHLSQTEVTLAQGETQTVPFTITIPDAVDVGEHSGGIIIQKAAAPEAGGGQIGASIITRVGIRIYENVPGKIVRKLALANFSVKETTAKGKQPLYAVSLSAKNLSNVSMKAVATLTISGWGKTAYFPNSKFKEGLFLDFSDFTNFFKGEKLTSQWQLLRDQTVSTPWEWPRPVFGQFTFRATISYPGDNGTETLVTQPITVTVIPWPLIISLGIIILLLVLGWFMRKMFSSGKKWKDYHVQQGDQLAALAAEAGISWKKLSKVNKLKAPMLTEGQIIKVPASLTVTQKKPQSAPAAEKVVAPKLDLSGIVNMPIRPVTKDDATPPVRQKITVRKAPIRKPRATSPKRVSRTPEKE